MPSSASILRILDWELTALLAALAIAVGLQLLLRQINLSGLLHEKDEAGQVSPARVQLLMATLAAAVQYLRSVPDAPAGTLPEVPKLWLYLMGGSSGIYVARKFYGAFIRPRTREEE